MKILSCTLKGYGLLSSKWSYCVKSIVVKSFNGSRSFLLLSCYFIFLERLFIDIPNAMVYYRPYDDLIISHHALTSAPHSQGGW